MQGFSGFKIQMSLYKTDYTVTKAHPSSTAFKKGFNNVIRFEVWNPHASKIERYLTSAYGSQYHTTPMWHAYFGAKQKGGIRPYFIGVKDESMTTAVLLSTAL
jgi:hypothetical protein